MKNAYPVSADLSAFLSAAFSTRTGLTIGSFDLATAVVAGIDRFETETGRVMLATGTSARSFDPPTGGRQVLDLGEDLAAITSVVAQGVTQVALSDYRALPQNAPARGRPYNRLQLTQRYYAPLYPGLWNSVVVTGNWGFSATGIAEDAWLAMVAAGALWLLPEIVTQTTGGMTSWTEASVTEQYGPKPFDALREQWDGLFERARDRYRRVEVGF